MEIKYPTNEELEAIRKAIEDQLVIRRDLRISVLRNNGLAIAEKDGTKSSIIRMSHEEAFLIGLEVLEDLRK